MNKPRVIAKEGETDESSSDLTDPSSDVNSEGGENEISISKKRKAQGESGEEKNTSEKESSSDHAYLSGDIESTDENQSLVLKKKKKQDKNEREKNKKEKNSDADLSSNLCWADAMSKVLHTKNLILSKAKRDNTVKKTDEQDLDKTMDLEKKKKRLLWHNMGRTKPHIGGREKERMLNRAATRGVVQLFNAVRQHQKVLGEKLKAVGDSETKKEKVLKSFNKGDFLDMLKKGTSENDKKVKSVDNKTWDVLRDDYMMEAKLKDWDKDSDNDE